MIKSKLFSLALIVVFMVIYFFSRESSFWGTSSFVFLITLTGVISVLMDKLTQKSKELHQVEHELHEKIDMLEKNDVENKQIYGSEEIKVFQYDITQRLLKISTGLENVIGYTRDDILRSGKAFWDNFIYEEDREEFFKEYSKIWTGKSLISKCRIVRKNGEIKLVKVIIKPILDREENVVAIFGTVDDLTEHERLKEKLKQLAFFDELTDLPNRYSLDRHLRKSIARMKRHNHEMAILFLDLDGFKKVNDTLGHEAGDQLLKQVAEKLTSSLREEDMISRLGGDEFVVIIEETEYAEVDMIAERLVNEIGQPYLINGEEVEVTPSIGISLYPKNGEDKESLLQKADQAMYYAKHNGKNNYQFYSNEVFDFVPKTGFVNRIVDSIKGLF